MVVRRLFGAGSMLCAVHDPHSVLCPIDVACLVLRRNLGLPISHPGTCTPHLTSMVKALSLAKLLLVLAPSVSPTSLIILVRHPLSSPTLMQSTLQSTQINQSAPSMPLHSAVSQRCHPAKAARAISVHPRSPLSPSPNPPLATTLSTRLRSPLLRGSSQGTDTSQTVPPHVGKGQARNI